MEVVVLLESKKITQIIWRSSTGPECPTPVACSDLDSYESAAWVASMNRDRLVLGWPNRLEQLSLVDRSRQESTGVLDPKGSFDFSEAPRLTCVMPLANKWLIFGDVDGRVLCCPPYPTEQPVFTAAVAGLRRCPREPGRVLAWAENGHLCSGERRSERFEVLSRWEMTDMPSEGRLRVCAIEKDRSVAVSVTPEGRATVTSFERGQPQSCIEIGDAPDGVVDAAMDEGQCVVVTSRQMIILHEHNVVRRLELPWANETNRPKQLHVQVLGREMFLLIAAKNVEIDFLLVNEAKYK